MATGKSSSNYSNSAIAPFSSLNPSLLCIYLFILIPNKQYRIVEEGSEETMGDTESERQSTLSDEAYKQVNRWFDK